MGGISYGALANLSLTWSLWACGADGGRFATNWTLIAIDEGTADTGLGLSTAILSPLLPLLL